VNYAVLQIRNQIKVWDYYIISELFMCLFYLFVINSNIHPGVWNRVWGVCSISVLFSFNGLVEVLGVDFVGVLLELGSAPEIGSEVSISMGEGIEGSLDEVALGSGLPARGGVDVTDTGELEHLLGGGGGHDVGTSGGGHEPDSDGTALAGNLGGDGMGVTDLVSPISSSDGVEVQLGVSDGPLDGSLNFLGTLPSESDVTIRVTDDHVGLEPGSLTSLSLLLDWLNLHNLLLQGLLKEVVNDIVLLDGDSPSEDFFNVLNLAGLNQSSELGKGLPFSLLTSSTEGLLGTTVGSSTTTATTASSSETSSSSATSFSSFTTSGSFSHVCNFLFISLV